MNNRLRFFKQRKRKIFDRNKKHFFFNKKLVYDLSTPFLNKSATELYPQKLKKKHVRNVICVRLYITNYVNNVIVSSAYSKSGNIICVITSKMFKNTSGRRKTHAMALYKKLGYVVALKTVLFSYGRQAIIVITKGTRLKRVKLLVQGLRYGGLYIMAFFFRSKKAHNGCRGKKVRENKEK